MPKWNALLRGFKRAAFATVDALYFLLDAPTDIRHRAEAIEQHREGID